jgi:serine protease AprX
MVALALPVAGIAGGKESGPKGPMIPPALLSAAQANPKATFNVILLGVPGLSADALGQNVNQGINANRQDNNNDNQQDGKLKRKFSHLSSVSATLTGRQLTWLARIPFIKAIVSDKPVKTNGDYQNAEMWRDTTGVSSLLSTPAVACAVDTLTGLALDPTCVPSPGLLAPPAPAIAIVDSGIDPTKAADFGARIVARGDFVVAEPAAGDPEGHGTMVAGLAAGGSADHIGASSNLVDVRVANSQGMALTSEILSGLDWILANKNTYGIKVVNMSLAGGAETSITFDPLDQAVEKLWLNGLVVVAAAGNHGLPDSPVALSSPGNDPFVITVGAIDQNQTTTMVDDFRAPWSAYGYTADGFSKPDLVAPGRFMISAIPEGSYIQTKEPARITGPGYMWMSGTSFSAPVVAGAAAQILAAHPDFTPDQVKGALLSTAGTVGAAPAPGLGAGELNAAAAVQVASPPNPNENLIPFVSVDPVTGLKTFSATSWVTTVSTTANWTSANWTSANWTSANWTSANWTLANWTSANWTSANWTLANWTLAGFAP